MTSILKPTAPALTLAMKLSMLATTIYPIDDELADLVVPDFVSHAPALVQGALDDNGNEGEMQNEFEDMRNPKNHIPQEQTISTMPRTSITPQTKERVHSMTTKTSITPETKERTHLTTAMTRLEPRMTTSTKVRRPETRQGTTSDREFPRHSVSMQPWTRPSMQRRTTRRYS